VASEELQAQLLRELQMHRQREQEVCSASCNPELDETVVSERSLFISNAHCKQRKRNCSNDSPTNKNILAK